MVVTPVTAMSRPNRQFVQTKQPVTDSFPMVQDERPIEDLRERLTGLLADWGTDLALLLDELGAKRARLAELESAAAEREERVTVLEQQTEAQSQLIETLKTDADETAALRGSLRDRELEVERLSSELDSKKDLIRALRRDAETVDRLKADAKRKDLDSAAMHKELRELRERNAALGTELAQLKEESATDESEQAAELEAMRAELDARRTLIKSLRADQDRAHALETSLEEKREVIAELEASLNRHVHTIAELKRNVDTWKRKFQGTTGAGATGTATLPGLTETDVRVIEHLEIAVEAGNSDATVAIDMRRSLLEARRAAQVGEK
jgi:chromosome segregation ATPase